ncbi:MAG TPA: hypothetical protein VIH59_03195 [Candidatus Tectomicrobia bacterium]
MNFDTGTVSHFLKLGTLAFAFATLVVLSSGSGVIARAHKVLAYGIANKTDARAIILNAQRASNSTVMDENEIGTVRVSGATFDYVVVASNATHRRGVVDRDVSLHRHAAP